MGDGAKRNKGVLLCTDNFSIREVVLLINILYFKFGFLASIHMDNKKPRIYISQKMLCSLGNTPTKKDILFKLQKHIIPSMRYKIRGLLDA
jgi:LAGLIDADG DNA endonuclease family